MSDNAITKFAQNTALTLDSVLAGLDNTLANAPTVESKEGVQYLKMAGPKSWVVGKEKDEVPLDEPLVVHPGRFTHGVVAWHGGMPEFQEMIPVNQSLSTIRLPDPSSLKAKNGLENARGMALAGMDEFFGVQMEFSSNSRGGREAIEALIKAVKAKSVEVGEVMFPVINLDTDGYNHREHGPITKPLFHVIEWMTEAEMQAAFDEPVEDEDAQAEAQPEPAPEPEAPKSTRRRRRTTA